MKKESFESQPEPVKIERSPQETQQLKERLRFVAKALSKNFDLKFIPGDGWAAGLSEKFQEEKRKHPEKSLEEFDEGLLTPEVMTYPEDELIARSEDYVFGVLRHELGHIKHSDYRAVIEFNEKVTEEGYLPMDLFTIYNAWEDGRVNNMESRTSKTARYRLGCYLKEDLAKVLLHDFDQKPLPIQYSLLGWAKGAGKIIPGLNFQEIKEKIKNEKVIEAFTKTEQFLDEYVEEEKGRKALREILWEKGWPVFKELVDKYVEEEARNIFEEMKKAIKEIIEKGIEEKAKGLHEEAGKESAKKEKGEEEGEKKVEQKPPSAEQEKTKEEKKDSGEQVDEDKEKEEKEKTEEKLKNKDAKKSWEELTEEEKEKYKKEAREKLLEEERKLVEKLKPHSVKIEEKEDGSIDVKTKEVEEEDIEKAKAEEHQQEREDRARQKKIEQVKKEDAEEAKKSLERLKERETGLSEEERELYDVYYSQVKKYVDQLVNRLDEIFPPREEGGWEGGHRRGKKIDTKTLAREIPIERGKFFEKKEVEEIKEMAFSLLIDVSGSMSGDKVKEALKAAILMAEVLSKKGIPFEITAFNAKIYHLKGFDEDYFGKKKIELMNLLREVYTEAAGYNDDGFAINEAAQRLQKKLLENDAYGALIVFSDGQPAPSHQHGGEEWELHGIVNKWSKKIPLIGIGIGPDMEQTIKRYYDKNGLPVPDVHKLPEALLRVLERQLARFQKK